MPVIVEQRALSTAEALANLPRIHGAGRTLLITGKTGTVYEVIGYDAIEEEVRLVHVESGVDMDWIFTTYHARNYTHTIL